MLKKAWRKTRTNARYTRKAFNTRNVGDLDVVVCSPGGVASSMVINHLMQFVRVNDLDDRDNLKHVPRPKLLLDDPAFKGRILYVYGEPTSVLASIERRGWVRIQGAKLGSRKAAFLPKSQSRNAFVRAVEDQIAAFKACSDPRVTTLPFSQIWDSLPAISKFLNIEDPRFVDEFPERKQRHTEKVP